MFKSMGYSPGFLVKKGQFRTLAKSREIHPNNRASTYKSICEHVIGVSGVWSDFRHLPKSAMFKSMGYSPGLSVKMGQFRTLAKSREIHPNNRASTYKSICEHVIGVSGSLDRFPTLTKIDHVQKHGL